MTLPIIWADFPIQWIIPAVFLVIWALNQVFGREERAMPPGRREPLGPRAPGAGGPQRGPRPIPARPDARRGNANDPAPRWPEPELEPRRREPVSRAPRRASDEDEIFMIPADSARNRPGGAAAGAGATGQGRRPGRGRSGGNQSSLRDAPPAQTINMNRSLGTSLLQAGSVNSTLGQLDAPNLEEAPARSLGAASLKEQGQAESIISLVDRTPEELRRAIILGEILRPPLAIRRPGR